MHIIESSKTDKVIYSWCPDVENLALTQMKSLVEQPFIFRHAALMPDAHPGNDVMPIGGVIATNGVVIPACVGVDIGCGMCAVKTSLKLSNMEDEIKATLLHSMERSIPVGFSHNNDTRQNEIVQKMESELDTLLTKHKDLFSASVQIFKDLRKDVISQLGTLGGGNHFLEIQVDQDDNVWAMLHSGSRNMGKRICDIFDEIAGDLNHKFHSNVADHIHFLPIDVIEGSEYLAYMNFALDFAFLNRQCMMEYVKKDIQHTFKHLNVNFDPPMINIHHNYAAIENHFGRNVWVHRKGATLASEKTVGIIPGSCGTNSYIVRGLGNIMSYRSCSHGAGRVMGRKAFNRQNNTPEKLRAIEKTMDGIVHSTFKKERTFKKDVNPLLDVSESPAAYKNIDDVMRNQEDLVQIMVTLKPIISMKG